MRDALVVRALELVDLITAEVLAEFGVLIRPVSTVVFSITAVGLPDTEVVGTLKPFSRAVLALGVSGRGTGMVTNSIIIR